MIGPEAVKNRMAVSWLAKVSCPGVRGASCAAAVPTAHPATAIAASAPAATRVLVCIVDPSSEVRSLLEWQVAYSSNYQIGKLYG